MELFVAPISTLTATWWLFLFVNWSNLISQQICSSMIHSSPPDSSCSLSLTLTHTHRQPLFWVNIISFEVCVYLLIEWGSETHSGPISVPGVNRQTERRTDDYTRSDQDLCLPSALAVVSVYMCALCVYRQSPFMTQNNVRPGIWAPTSLSAKRMCWTAERGNIQHTSGKTTRMEKYHTLTHGLWSLYTGTPFLYISCFLRLFNKRFHLSLGWRRFALESQSWTPMFMLTCPPLPWMTTLISVFLASIR